MSIVLKIYLFFLIITIICFGIIEIEVKNKIKRYYPDFILWSKEHKTKYTIPEHIVSIFRIIIPFLIPIYRMMFIVAIGSESIFKQIVEETVYGVFDKYNYEYKYVNLWK